MLAYHNRCDLIFKEQDCLAFGPWIDRLYAEIGQAELSAARSMTQTAPRAYWRNRWSWSAIASFSASRRSTCRSPRAAPRSAAKTNSRGSAPCPIDGSPSMALTSMGFDRSRPVDYDRPFYMQQVTADELANSVGVA